MRMFVASIIGLAGLVSLFAYCRPLRERARDVVFGREAMVLSSTTATAPRAVDGTAAKRVEVHGGST
jgi:hypothetical protein